MATAAAIDVLLRANVAQYRASMLEAGRITNQQMAGIRKEVSSTSQAVQTFNRLAVGFVGFQGLKTASVELARIADGFSNVQAKIRLAAGENANVAASLGKVFDVAQRTFNTLDGTAALVQRGSQALRSFGQNADEAFSNSVQLAELFNKGLVVSGASASEAASAALQFSQALASGRFQGDEFRSVLENNSRFASLLADSLGVNIAQLRDMSKEGQLTTQTFLNLIGKTAELDAEFARMPLTIGRAKTLLDNAFTKFIGEADQARGASRGIATAISALANNLGPVANALGQLAIVTAGAFSARAILAAKAYAGSLLEQATAAKAAQLATQQKAAADSQAAQATLLKARGEQVAAEQTAAAVAADRARIQSVIAMATAQEAVIRANALRATSEIELARLSQQLTAVESARAAATLALGEARAAEVRANAQLLVSNRALQAAYATTGAEGAAAAAKITIGMRAASIAQSAMTIATRAFSGALALVGGPLGVVIIGVGLLASAFANARVKADQAAASIKAAIQASNDFQDNQSRAGAIQAQTALISERAKAEEDLAKKQALRSNFSITGLYIDSTGPTTGSALDDEIRQQQAQIKELTRQIDLNNKKIIENHDAWNQDGKAVSEANGNYEKQNAALDKQLENLTAQRLELTKGYRARLEYEAVQEQGVKTAAELDAGTKSRIDALVKEHAALKAATDSKKSGAKADRESLAASKAQESQYSSIIDRINRQIALDKEAMLTNDEMTAAQKLQVTVTNELASAKNKLSDAEQERVKALLAEAISQGTALKNMQDAKKGAEDLLRLQNQLNESIRTQNAENETDLLGIGRGGDSVERMRRQVDIQREYQRQVESLNLQLAAAGGDKATDAAKKGYQNQLDALKSYHESALSSEEEYQRRRVEMQSDWTNGFQRSVDDYLASAQDIAGQSYEIFNNAFQGLEDTLVEFVTTGKASFGDLLNSIAADITRFVVRQQLSKWLQSLFGGKTSDTNFGEAAGSIFDLFSGSDFGFERGGYTGTGDRRQPAGIVHKNEVVWSQLDVARAGGVAAVEGMRRGIRGYANGGIVAGSSLVKLGRRADDSDTPAGANGRSMSVTQNFAFAAPISPKTQTQVAARTGYEIQRSQRLGGR